VALRTAAAVQEPTSSSNNNNNKNNSFTIASTTRQTYLAAVSLFYDINDILLRKRLQAKAAASALFHIQRDKWRTRAVF
jgi:hypothetical protein